MPNPSNKQVMCSDRDMPSEEDDMLGDMIIINGDDGSNDDKKVVFLSNINSCSLP